MNRGYRNRTSGPPRPIELDFLMINIYGFEQVVEKVEAQADKVC
jgi:hypothetical protein